MTEAPNISLDVTVDDARPYFLWDTTLTTVALRSHLSSQDASVRLYWTARVMRDARYADVWAFLKLKDILADWEALRPRLGRERERWEFLIDGWRADGLIP